VSHLDDERPDPAGPEQPDLHGGPSDETDTRPLQAGSTPETPGPQPPPYGGPVFGQPTHPAYAPPGDGRPGPMGTYAWQPQHPAPAPTNRFPGWAWPAMTVLALVVGALGGVLGGVAVSNSMRSGGGEEIPVVSTDNGAAAPLRADNSSLAAVAAKILPSTVQIQANGGAGGTTKGGATGSGFVLDDKGHVITNNHVVADATEPGRIEILDRKGRRYAARIVGRSPVYDIAVLEVSGARGPDMVPASIGSSRALRVGDTVVAIGSPLGLSSTVTSGIVSATNRPVTTGDSARSYINALQTDAAINPGNSGGPLVNVRGQVIGVNSAIATTGGTLSGPSGNIGVGFAIPMEQVRVTAGQILATGKARYPVIGANVDTQDSSRGATVVSVPSGTPAAVGGLRKGDVVTRVDGVPVADGIGLIVAIRSHRPGETIDLAVRRDGHIRDVEVRLDSKVG
jgi:putative serine protease PepD